jgi:hypothetical protein
MAAEHAVLAMQEGEKITFESSVYPREVIYAEDLNKLDPDIQKSTIQNPP